MDRIRAVVLERDEWLCQDCGIAVGNASDRKPTAELHHHIPKSEGGEYKPQNLIALCPNCHSKRPGKSQLSGAGRPPDPPLPDEILDAMTPNHCYVVADLVEEFHDDYDPSRGTVRNRLEYLHEQGDVHRRKHANGTVTYRPIGEHDPE